ncbi:XdhC family protein [Bhargavaea ullalensis]|uniref:Xanthine/CO dehydrogenase XdhC/CoxF family maturation factor n=1 Tax=Bhargavaea ullalensis TaxID=1265685 RepID=A0ABV2G8B9_9BACL
MTGTFAQWKKLLEEEGPAALVTLVRVEGSSYRKAGAMMIIGTCGCTAGMVSGGCLEEDLSGRAAALAGTGRVELHRYDLSSEDDLGWGLGAGCNGVLTLLVRDADKRFREALRRAVGRLDAKEPVLFLQETDGDKYAFFSLGGGLDGTLKLPGTGQPERLLMESRPFSRFSEELETAAGPVHARLVWPQPALYLIGAGMDARPLARLASGFGYAVHLVDWRPGLCSAVHFPDAANFWTGPVEDSVRSIPFSPLDSAVVMTHDFARDRSVLGHLLEEDLFYLGVLGSRKRTERLIGGPMPGRVRSPVGLPIGADGPEEIALSILAELIAVREQKTACVQ